jgi:hypothetical protein
MAHSYFHAKSSAKKFGGKLEDYLPLHCWFDESKSYIAEAQHRALRHHSEGIFMAEKIFGQIIKNSVGKEIPVRIVGEQHMLEDFGFIPTVADWLLKIPLEPWMYKKAKKLSKTL